MMEDKVMSIGIASKLTGLTERQIRYYEQRKLIFPERTEGGIRKYSFEDVEKLKVIHEKLNDGLNTFELKQLQSKPFLRKI
jgi:MerR family transcriptional regulator, global nitrogen regulator